MIEESTFRPSFELLDRFQAFVAELDRQRALVLHTVAQRAIAAKPEDETDYDRDFPAFLLDAPVAVAEREAEEEAATPATPAIDPEIILERLQAYLTTELRSVARRASDLMLAQYREVQYAMVALADDVFIHEIEWDGREAWRANHLEHRVFHSRLAGERIFERIEALLVTRDRRLIQLASIYLCILSLGFKGRFRGPGGEGHLQDYAQRLFEMVAGREPALLSNWSSGTLRPIVPSAYMHTVKGDAARRYGWRPRWLLVLAAVILAWLVAGHLIWVTVAAPVADSAQSVLRAAGDVK